MVKQRKFFSGVFEYLDHVSRLGRDYQAEHTTDIVAKLMHHKNETKLPSVLGLCDDFR